MDKFKNISISLKETTIEKLDELIEIYEKDYDMEVTRSGLINNLICKEIKKRKDQEK